MVCKNGLVYSVGMAREGRANYALYTTAKPLHGLATLAALGAGELRR